MEKVDTLPANQQRRTTAQNNALHLWLTQVAEILNDEGITLTEVLSKFILEVPVTPKNLKEDVFKSLIDSLYGKKSTTEMSKKQEIDQTVETLNKFFGETWGVLLPPFPSLESLSLKSFE